MLSKNLIIGLMIVFLLLWCFLNARLSFWGGMGIPVSIAGAMAILRAIGGTINMVSLFGLILVLGIVVDDAIVLIERVNENIAEEMSFFDAILSGGARRFRAIFLTSLSTIGGLAPLIMETDFQAKFLIPMALSIAAGIAFATVLTLVLVPSLMALLSDARLVVHRLKYGFWPKRVDVEPARDRHFDPLADEADEPAIESIHMIN